jgi:antitoxin VapB
LKSPEIYTLDIYQGAGAADMSAKRIAKLFMHGRSQAVRLPLAFRLPGSQVRVSRRGKGVLLEPIAADADAWFAELDRFVDIPFMEDGRDQPAMPAARKVFPR